MTIQYHRMEDTSIHQQEVHGPELPHHCTGSYGSPCAWMVCSTDSTRSYMPWHVVDQEQQTSTGHRSTMDPWIHEHP